MSRVCILNYGSGNVGSVHNLFSHITTDLIVSNRAADVANASHVVLPGVGAFGAAMRKVRQTLPLEELEKSVLRNGKPLLGICVGMQILANRGTEFGEHAGLGWIRGSVERLEAGPLSLPHIGWNNINIAAPSALFDGLGDSPDFYYVHSFIFHPESPESTIATTEYGQHFPAVINRENIFGVQFHPEKSQTAGLRLARNFLAIA